MLKVSLIIPIYNEEGSLLELYAAIKKAVRSFHEIIFINDGSSDNSLNLMKELVTTDQRVKVISFRRNLGKAMALNRGFEKAEGDIIVTLDGDLQDDPENIPLLIEKINEGYDLVVGWKKKRNDPKNKTIPSKFFNFFVKSISKINLHDFNSGLKVMKKDVAKELILYGELHRFIPVLAYQLGFKVTELPITHYPRKFGVSKYGWDRFFKGFFDFLTVIFIDKFSQRPLHFFGLIGSVGILIGFVLGIYLSVLHFEGIAISRRPLLILSVLLIVAGLQMLSIGLIAEIIIRKSNSSKIQLPIDYETR